MKTLFVTIQVATSRPDLLLSKAWLRWRALECQGKSVEEIIALLTHGSEIGADGAKGIEAGWGTEAAGDFLFNFGHTPQTKARIYGRIRESARRDNPEERFRVKYPRQEPCAVIPLAGICAGGRG